MFERPCGLAKLLQAMSIFLATRFIPFKKEFTSYSEYAAISLLTDELNYFTVINEPSLWCLNRYPPNSAIRYAASFPLGSIIPKYKSKSVYSAPYLSSAVVPLISQAVLEALTLNSFGSRPRDAVSSRMVTRFIILVRLAISRRLWLRWLQSALPCCISYTIQLLAVTLGGTSLRITIFFAYCE